MKSSHFDVIIVGGGSAGLMAGVNAAAKGRRVCILEKNSFVGKKLSITGGGRCNITNATFDNKKLLLHYGEAAKFLHSSFAEFAPKDTIDFFEKLQLPIVVQDFNRAFPKSEKAPDVVFVLENELKKLGVKIFCNETVVDIKKEQEFIVTTKKTTFTASSLILATGGLSHPETGSTGDGFNFLQKLGHTITKPNPTLVPLLVSEKWISDLAGVALDDCKVTVLVDGKKEFSFAGRVLCTHNGLSGPIILNNSHTIAQLIPNGIVTARLNILSHITVDVIQKTLLGWLDINKNKLVKTVLAEYIPSKLVSIVLQLARIQQNQVCNSLTKESRITLAHVLQNIPLTITGLAGFDKAIISDGGVPLHEIDTKTFMSKKVSNLFIIGDLLHVNRPSGGYSLQLCWTSGYVAGKNS